MKFREGIFVLVIVFLLGIVSADILSINSGGDNQLVINPESNIEGFFFNFNLRPLMSNVILNSTFGTNFTTENLSVYYTSSDPDDDIITNISDWRLDGSSIAVLNLPFDSYKIQGDVRDYSTYENNGTLGGGNNNKAPLWENSCVVGGCYEFDGVDDYVAVPQINFAAGDNWTLSAWINQTGTKSFEFWTGNINSVTMCINFDDVLGRVHYRSSNATYYTWDTGVDYKNSWHYFVWIVKGNSSGVGEIELFVDGTSYGIVNPLTDFIINGIGRGYSTEAWNFEGQIDEFQVYDKTLSSEQIKLNYNSGLAGHSTETLVSQETDKGDVWQVAMTSNDAFYDSITSLSNELTIFNNGPIDPEPVLVSVDGTNESDADLNCSSYIYDGDSDYLNVSVRWYKDDVLNLSIDYDNDYSNGSLFYAILDSGNLTLGDVWNCSIRLDDGEDTSNWVESNELEIIDITDPIVYIISPESTNYSYLNISFNVSIIENENMSLCFYDLDDEGNVTMNELNDSYFWYEPSLGPGDHEVWFYCNDTSGNWGSNYTNFTIDNEAAIAILLSPLLLQQVGWDVLTLPIDDLDAVGNNGENETDYFVNISTTNTLVDLYVRADGDLFNVGLDVIGLGNETFSFSNNNSYVNESSKVVMNTTYILIGDALGGNSTVFLMILTPYFIILSKAAINCSSSVSM